MLLKHLRSYFITSFWIIFDIQICTVIIKHPHPHTIVILMRLISVSAGFLFKTYFLNKSEQQYTHPLCWKMFRNCLIKFLTITYQKGCHLYTSFTSIHRQLKSTRQCLYNMPHFLSNCKLNNYTSYRHIYSTPNYCHAPFSEAHVY